MSWFYYVGRALMWALLKALTRWEVKGEENVPPEGPLIIAANHLHLADPPLVGISVPRRMVFMAKEELFRSRVWGYFVRSFGSFPVHRTRLDREALRQSDQTLRAGLALVMFPEGTRSPDAQLQSAFLGSALIAARSNAPILPVGITGTEKIKGISWLWHRPRITVNIGCPFNLPPVNGRLTKIELAQLTDYVMRNIAVLLPHSYQGVYRETE